MTVIVANQSSSGLSPLGPGDEEFYYFNFAAWLPAGVTLVSAVTTAFDPSGTEVSAQMCSPPATVENGGVARQMMTGLTLGISYSVRCKGTFSDGQSETLSATILIGFNFGTAS